MSTDAPPPDDLDPSHLLSADEWAAVEADREWIQQMKAPLTAAELAEIHAADEQEGDGDVVQS